MPLLQLMAATAFGLIFFPPRHGAPAGIWGALAALGLVALQLVPLPPRLLARFQPALIGEIRAYAGHNDWAASTTDLYATFGFFSFALLGATLYVIFRNTGRAVIIHCLYATVIVALASLTVAAIQISSGGDTFDFWNSPHVLNGPGFFANRNHQALFLGLASATVWWLAKLRGGHSSRASDKTRGIALFCSLALLLGAVGTASRAGIVLAVGSTILAIALFQRPSRRIGIATISIAAGIFAPGLAALAIFNDTVAGALNRFEAIDVDARWQLWATSWIAAKEFFPLGSGYGTFIPVYAMVEPIDQLTPAYANHAHNEYLELFLEGGLPFAIGFALFLAVFAKRLTAIFRHHDSPPSLAPLGALWMIAFLLHSLVDYPVRVPSLLALFAMGLAMTFAEHGEHTTHGSPPPSKDRKSMKTMLRLALPGLAMLAGCAPTPSLDNTRARLATPDAFPSAQHAIYRVGPADTLQINVFGEPGLSFEAITVDATGTIPFPLIGNLAVSGLTGEEISRLIAGRLGQRYIVDPQVTVFIARSAAQRLTVEGDVVKPGVFDIQGDTSLIQAMAMAQGPTRTAKLNEIIVFREVGEELYVARFDLAKVRKGIEPNIPLEGGDIVVVGYSQVKGTLRDVLQASPLLTALFVRAL